MYLLDLQLGSRVLCMTLPPQRKVVGQIFQQAFSYRTAVDGEM